MEEIMSGRLKTMISALLAMLMIACGGAPTATADEQRIEIESDGWKLIGTLRMPDNATGDVPLVILMHQFNNERSVYKKLAGLLAERGIASLRLDLRGHGESTNRGGINRHQLLTTWPDVVAAIKYVEGLEGVDHARIGSLSASYSGEAVARAGREYRYPAANIMLSSGTMTAESIAALAACETQWWFVAAKDDPRSAENMAKADASAKHSEFTNFDSGGHGSNMFDAHADLEAKIADWFAAKLK
jgi:dienelactone hydrolase